MVTARIPIQESNATGHHTNSDTEKSLSTSPASELDFDCLNWLSRNREIRADDRQCTGPTTTTTRQGISLNNVKRKKMHNKIKEKYEATTCLITECLWNEFFGIGELPSGQTLDSTKSNTMKNNTQRIVDNANVSYPPYTTE